MNRLNILTTADYPTFLPLLQASIQHCQPEWPIDIHWWVLKTNTKPLPSLTIPHTIVEDKEEHEFINDVIDQEDIQSKNTADVIDILDDLPGVSFENIFSSKNSFFIASSRLSILTSICSTFCFLYLYK